MCSLAVDGIHGETLSVNIWNLIKPHVGLKCFLCTLQLISIFPIVGCLLAKKTANNSQFGKILKYLVCWNNIT